MPPHHPSSQRSTAAASNGTHFDRRQPLGSWDCSSNFWEYSCPAPQDLHCVGQCRRTAAEGMSTPRFRGHDVFRHETSGKKPQSSTDSSSHESDCHWADGCTCQHPLSPTQASIASRPFVCCHLHCMVVDSITGDLPDWQMDGVRGCPELQNIPLADPDFNRPGRIDVLLGMDAYQQVILEGQPLLNQQLKATCSIFGWIISGSKESSPTQARAHLCLRTTTKDTEMQDFLQKFWEVEQPL